ncbi:DNA-binding transcriptional regulator, MarR family [Saccharopolyspora antimicrobica]|uniref:DNA-binding MarR family transcriptional regulator n=1 Tax=Saccharopolyspora antimicrobica TaxID=455193 RepID=A0A1I4S8I6_9PSEU|nr:transcriptional regulator [Saccharopolyspora antimicrobica]RKT87639.1 DNA-binding MarR family transcriptional regulator [Saccharopolyspora antimicrobica]SFM60815.1 DNA-binding transcriptional regulator, MarR family [Saccharopolyspora antimicrobica]
MNHPRRELDPVIHSPVRFSVVAALSGVEQAEFRFIRDTVEVSDSALSQHVAALEQAGYVKVTKGRAGRRAKTWLALTESGRRAFTHHLAVLNRIATEPPQPPPEP